MKFPKPIKAYGLSRPMKRVLVDAIEGDCRPHANTRIALIDRGLLSPTGDGRSARLTPSGFTVAKWIQQDDARKRGEAHTIFGRTPVGHVLLDPHGDPWVRVPDGVVEVVMRPSNGGPPVRILHPVEDFAECEDEFGPFTEVGEA